MSGTESIKFPVTLSQPSNNTVTVNYTTVDDSALAGVDYVAQSGTLVFAPGVVEKDVYVQVLGDPTANVDKGFRLSLSSPFNATLSSDPVAEFFISLYAPATVLPTLTVAFVDIETATFTPLTPLSAVGNQFVDANGSKVRLRGINWYGCEGTSLIPHGMYTTGVSYTGLLDLIAELGFNFIRLPFADELMTSTVVFGSTGGPQFIDVNANPDLVGLTPLQAIDKIIAYGASIGLRFLLDQHRISINVIGNSYDNGYGTDGWPAADPVNDTAYSGLASGSYTIANWHSLWTSVATHFTSGQYAAGGAAHGCIAGFDPHNEPFNVSWATWVGMVQDLCAVVHAIAPDWMVFVEGVWKAASGDEYWFGGQLADMANNHVTITRQNKVCYQAHDYGQDVSSQPWLASVNPANTVVGYPANLEMEFDEHWGYIYRDNLAPVIIGEFGGRFGFNGSGAADASQINAAFEVDWLQSLIKYMNGGRNDGSSMLVNANDAPFSFALFALNPESIYVLNGVTLGIGGLMQDDYIHVQAGKMALLQPLIEV